MADFWHSMSSNLPTRGRLLFSVLLGYSLTHITMECVGQAFPYSLLVLSSIGSESLKETFVTEVELAVPSNGASSSMLLCGGQRI